MWCCNMHCAKEQVLRVQNQGSSGLWETPWVYYVYLGRYTFRHDLLPVSDFSPPPCLHSSMAKEASPTETERSQLLASGYFISLKKLLSQPVYTLENSNSESDFPLSPGDLRENFVWLPRKPWSPRPQMCHGPGAWAKEPPR